MSCFPRIFPNRHAGHHPKYPPAQSGRGSERIGGQNFTMVACGSPWLSIVSQKSEKALRIVPYSKRVVYSSQFPLSAEGKKSCLKLNTKAQGPTLLKGETSTLTPPSTCIFLPARLEKILGRVSYTEVTFNPIVYRIGQLDIAWSISPIRRIVSLRATIIFW